MTDVPVIPLLRFGEQYTSLELSELRSPRDGRLLARVSQANPGLLRRDLLTRASDAAAALRVHSTSDLIALAKEAGRLFLEGDLPIALTGRVYVRCTGPWSPATC